MLGTVPMGKGPVVADCGDFLNVFKLALRARRGQCSPLRSHSGGGGRPAGGQRAARHQHRFVNPRLMIILSITQSIHQPTLAPNRPPGHPYGSHLWLGRPTRATGVEGPMARRCEKSMARPIDQSTGSLNPPSNRLLGYPHAGTLGSAAWPGWLARRPVPGSAAPAAGPENRLPDDCRF